MMAALAVPSSERTTYAPARDRRLQTGSQWLSRAARSRKEPGFFVRIKKVTMKFLLIILAVNGLMQYLFPQKDMKR
jgi:hypothetical protein